MIWNTDRMDYFAADFFQGMGLAMPDRWEPPDRRTERRGHRAKGL